MCTGERPQGLIGVEMTSSYVTDFQPHPVNGPNAAKDSGLFKDVPTTLLKDSSFP